MENKLSE